MSRDMLEQLVFPSLLLLTVVCITVVVLALLHRHRIKKPDSSS